MSSEPPSPPAHPAAPATRRCDIQLQNPCRYAEAGARRLRPWLEPVVAELAPQAESLAVRFVSDREMRRLNAAFRRRDEPTDVLSFPGDAEPAPPGGTAVGAAPGAPPGDVHLGDVHLGDVHLGDVVVSVPAARRQARRLGHSVETELRILTLHGVLHCLGYDHETDDGTMERLERRLRRRWVGRG